MIDSGVGGLTVVKEILKRLPNESIVYLGDDLRCPYGSRSEEEVRIFTVEMVTKLAAMDIKMLVIACNTATAVALETIRERFRFPVIGVVVPGARAAVTQSKTNHIAVLGTTRTIESRAYDEEILRQAPGAVVYPLACPDFVPIVESGQYRSMNAREVIHRTLQNIAHQDFDTAILGCTHYPLLEAHIASCLPKHVQIISSAEETAKDVENALNHQHLKNREDVEATAIFYTTGPRESFEAIVKDWLMLDHPDVQTIKLP